jgi:hypothetical protein
MECLKSWAHEIHNMGGIVGETLLVQLSAIETIHEEAQGTPQRPRAARKATGFASQTSQIMAQLGIVGFDRVGLRFALRDFVSSTVIPQPLIGLERITVIPAGPGCLIHNLLKGLLRPPPDHRPAHDTAGGAIHHRQNIDLVFFSPMKVKSSSISASWITSGTGALGRACATSVTQ